MLKDLLTNVAITIGATTGIVTIVDWMLTPTQRRKLRSWGDHIWLWLDEQRLGKFNNYLLNRKLQTALSVVGFGTVNFFVAFKTPLATKPDQSIILLMAGNVLGTLITTVFVLRDIHPIIASWMVGDNKLGAFFKRCVKAFLIGLLVNISILYLIVPVLTPILAYGFTVGGPRPLYEYSPYFTLGVNLFLYLAFSHIMIEASLVINTFLLSIAWIILTVVLMILFRTTQFFVLRIVDYPNGPVLALGGLLTGIAALVKAFL